MVDQNGHEKVRPFKHIPEEHLLVIAKKVMRNWSMWKCVMDHLCDRLDDLKGRVSVMGMGVMGIRDLYEPGSCS